MKNKYNHIFFDLDRTLWDFEKNSREAIRSIFKNHQLDDLLSKFDDFIEIYTIHNDRLWNAYRKGQIRKNELRVTRFHLALKEFGINNIELARLIDKEYIATSPRNSYLISGTKEVLDILSQKYRLYIITNGFKEVQYIKMESTSIISYFVKIFTSDDIGHSKPDKKIFEAAITSINAKKQECLMVGDDLEIDIYGAKQFGIDQVYFNQKKIPHHANPTYEISKLTELFNIL